MTKIWKSIKTTKVIKQEFEYDKLIDNDSNKQKLIEIKNIKVSFWHHFKKIEILSDVSFDIYSNEIVALLGSNGAGKTTLVNTIMGIIKHQNGTIKYHNENKSINDFISAQFQDLKFPQGLNVKDMIEFELNMGTNKIDVTTLQTMLDTFKLTEFLNKPVSKLSGGQQQRLNVILAMVNKCKIIFLDEFTTGLDIAAKYEITEFIYKFCKQNQISVVLISHDIEAIERLAERFIVIANKQVIVDAPKKVVINKYKSIEAFLKYYIR